MRDEVVVVITAIKPKLKDAPSGQFCYGPSLALLARLWVSALTSSHSMMSATRGSMLVYVMIKLISAKRISSGDKLKSRRPAPCRCCRRIPFWPSIFWLLILYARFLSLSLLNVI